MSMDYIRTHYRVPAKKGARVKAYGKPGQITGADGPYVRIRLDGQKHSNNYHPTDEIEYLGAPLVTSAVGGGLEDRIAKVIADVIGHGMAEKCEPHARAVVELLAAGQVPEGWPDAAAVERAAEALYGLGKNANPFARTLPEIQETMRVLARPVLGAATGQGAL